MVTKNGGKKRAKQCFQKHTDSGAKNVGKKIVAKKCEKSFLNLQEYRDQKRGGKNARNNISRNTPIVPAKNVGKKIVEKIAKKRFSYSHEYRDQKIVEKKRVKQFFEKHTSIAGKKCWKKSS